MDKQLRPFEIIDAMARERSQRSDQAIIDELEAIVNPDWAGLADICMAAIECGRPGTVLWAVHQLSVLEDERARPLLQEMVCSKHEEIAWGAKIAIQRLDKAAMKPPS